MTNYRLEGLKRQSEEVIQDLKKDGLLPPDIEVIGALLFIKYQGSDEKLEEMFSNTAELMEKTKALLERLKNNE